MCVLVQQIIDKWRSKFGQEHVTVDTVIKLGQSKVFKRLIKKYTTLPQVSELLRTSVF